MTNKNTPNTQDSKSESPKKKKRSLFKILIVLIIIILLFALAPFISDYIGTQAISSENIDNALSRSQWIKKTSLDLFYNNFFISIPLYSLIAFYVIPQWIKNSPLMKVYSEKNKVSIKKIITDFKFSNTYPSKKIKYLAFFMTMKGRLLAFALFVVIDASFGLLPTSLIG